MAYKKNYKSQCHLSVGDLNDFIKQIEDKEQGYTLALTNIANRVADEMLTEVLSSKYTAKDGNNPYADTQKEVKTEKDKGIAIIRNTEPKALFYEMGTGVVGAEHPAVGEYVQLFGWKYDHHLHGEAGWVYPKGDGTFGRTSGLVAMNGFYNAFKQIEQNINNITREELEKM